MKVLGEEGMGMDAPHTLPHSHTHIQYTVHAAVYAFADTGTPLNVSINVFEVTLACVLPLRQSRDPGRCFVDQM